MFSSFGHPVPPTVHAPQPCLPTSLFLRCQGHPGPGLHLPSPGTHLITASLETCNKVGVTGARLQIILHQFRRPLDVPEYEAPAWPVVFIKACV